jgi:hypothetical protein
MTAIRFTAEVAKVQTLADLGIRLTLDLPEDAVSVAAQLMECKRQGIPLVFEAKVEPEKREKGGDDRTRTRRQVSKRQ